ncbi:hypothetical protein [Micromonospora sp. NPDC047730]|uniref:hypothetical protein n=1 Tax=Micromonospora sp. NPDC047730 TaxID=3364253 RepID=UPI00371C79DD
MTSLHPHAHDLHVQLVGWANSQGWRGTSRKKVPIAQVWAAFQALKYHEPDAVHGSTQLSQLLKDLQEHRLVTPGRADDREKIPLPLLVWLEATTTASSATPPPMPRWHHSIYDLAHHWQTATPKQRAAYTAINTWLMSNPDQTPVPIRERALEIFGMFGIEDHFPFPEKTFGTLKSGPLFSDTDRLLALLHAFTIPPPLLTERFLNEVGDGYYQRVGKGDLLMVVENSATWWSLVHALPQDHSLGYLAWGLGNTFTASIESISDKHGITEVRYFGDLDLTGVRIPRAAARTAITHNLPPVRPAMHLYADLAKVGRCTPSRERKVSTTEAADLVDWLPPSLRRTAAQLLVNGRRIAQEWVGYRHLIQKSTWHADVV